MSLSRELRQRQTEVEKCLWSKLKNRQLDGIKFRRQHSIGRYIVDFVSLDKKIIIELDGGQHNETPAKEQDELRTKWLEEEGYRVIRFWDNDITSNIEGVLTSIREVMK